ncbi:hypothetical protein B1810_19695 [Panacagrimonas perspica]|nr:hypothetical protein B1810_19695 [Panacagrimonas perspica]
MAPRDLAGRYALITGGASGLGLGCALELAARGAQVCIADLDSNAALAAERVIRSAHPAVSVHCEPLDLADADSVRGLADRLLAQGRPIDLLINNAGIYPPSQRALAAQGVELGFAIAVLGHYALTARLWPLLEAAPAARVVCVSSLVQRRARIDVDDLGLDRGYHPYRAYQQAKLGSLLFARELARRLALAGSPVRAQAAHPGVCRTNIGANRRRHAQDTPLQRFSSWLLAFGMRFHGQTPAQGALAVIEAATSPHIQPGDFIGPKGFLEAAGPIGVVEPGPAARDSRLAAALWQRLEVLSGLRFPF